MALDNQSQSAQQGYQVQCRAYALGQTEAVIRQPVLGLEYKLISQFE